MKASGNIFSWLGMKQEQEVLTLATKHIDTVLACVKTFQAAVDQFASNEKEAKDESIKKVRQYEKDADAMRIDMVRRISEGVVATTDREELLKFVLTLDRIADWTNGAARLVGFLTEPLPNGIMSNMRLSAASIVMAVEDLQKSVDALIAGKNKEAIDLSLRVHAIESEEDDRKQNSLSQILTADLSTPRLLLAYNLSEYLESITDKIEDASDFIKVIAVRSK
jgi:predicted phosphate transport protein (TIGR00153 family)